MVKLSSTHPECRHLRGMISRCYREYNPSYPNYGGRGITVCDQWLSDPASYVRWAEANGAAPDLWIDRIDNDKGYEPSNCRFVSPKENNRSRRDNRKICVFGQEVTLAEAAESYGVPYDTLRQRIVKLRWPVERAVTEPLHATNPGKKSRRKEARDAS